MATQTQITCKFVYFNADELQARDIIQFHSGEVYLVKSISPKKGVVQLINNYFNWQFTDPQKIVTTTKKLVGDGTKRLAPQIYTDHKLVAAATPKTLSDFEKFRGELYFIYTIFYGGKHKNFRFLSNFKK